MHSDSVDALRAAAAQLHENPRTAGFAGDPVLVSAELFDLAAFGAFVVHEFNHGHPHVPDGVPVLNLSVRSSSLATDEAGHQTDGVGRVQLGVGEGACVHETVVHEDPRLGLGRIGHNLWAGHLDVCVASLVGHGHGVGRQVVFLFVLHVHHSNSTNPPLEVV